MSASDELPYFGTQNNPTVEAEDAVQDVDITVQSELSGMKAAMLEILDSQTAINPNLPAVEYKIQGIANDRVRAILTPIIATIDTRLKKKG